ncbi:hypothetical protein L0F63_003091, partial [Massospora cicadina]
QCLLTQYTPTKVEGSIKDSSSGKIPEASVTKQPPPPAHYSTGKRSNGREGKREKAFFQKEKGIGDERVGASSLAVQLTPNRPSPSQPEVLKPVNQSAYSSTRQRSQPLPCHHDQLVPSKNPLQVVHESDLKPKPLSQEPLLKSPVNVLSSKLIKKIKLAPDLECMQEFGTAGPKNPHAIGAYSSLPIQIEKLIFEVKSLHDLLMTPNDWEDKDETVQKILARHSYNTKVENGKLYKQVGAKWLPYYSLWNV